MSLAWLRKLFLGTVDIPSPSDIIQPTGIIADEYAGKVIVDLRQNNIGLDKLKVWIPTIPDTNSMDPNFDHEHNNILIAGADEANQKKLVDFLKIGDIAVYRSPRMYAIHRIVDIGEDDKGIYFIFKGDNNYARDLYKVRTKEILWISSGTIF